MGHFLQLGVDAIGEGVWAGDGASDGLLKGAEALLAFCGEVVGGLGEDGLGLIEELGEDVLGLFWFGGIV